jgi:hypothetical protein
LVKNIKKYNKINAIICENIFKLKKMKKCLEFDRFNFGRKVKCIGIDTQYIYDANYNDRYYQMMIFKESRL